MKNNNCQKLGLKDIICPSLIHVDTAKLCNHASYYYFVKCAILKYFFSVQQGEKAILL